MLCAGGAAQAVSHVFLVQNSGWMEPFFSDPASPYKALVTELALAVTGPDDQMVLAAFNQSRPGAPSPKALLSLTVGAAGARAQISAALAGLNTATKPGSSVLADTDLSEAVNAAIGQALDHKSGLVWLFTNNRNSPNNDQSTAQRNRDFYTLIHQGEAISKALAFPLKMPVQGAHYRAGGLMVYVLAIGAQGARALDALLAGGRIQKVITETPARLKPLDRDTVRLLPTKVSDAPGVAFSMTPGGMLRADIDAGARAPFANIDWHLENTMYPYTIKHAKLAAHALLGGQDSAITLGSDQVAELVPGVGAALSSRLALPVTQLPGNWSLAALKSAGSAYVLPGRIELQLSDQQLALSQPFRARMAELFPGDPLPDIFTPPSQLHGSTALLPLEVRVHFGVAPLLALIGGVLAALGLGAAATLALTRPRRVLVTVEGELRTMHASVGSSLPLYDKAGNQVAQLKTSLFGHQLTDLRDGAQVRLGR